ncbi:MAG: beta-galactosidase [Clostridiales bacterium]|nr:beta-galactosidase [Clostridiales bacterium]
MGEYKAKIQITEKLLTDGAVLRERYGNGACLTLKANGSGIDLTEFITGNSRYLFFWLETKEEHCVPFGFFLYQGQEMVAEIRLGILSDVATPICIDANWLDGQELFPKANVGELKIVCHGGRTDRSKITRAVFASLPSFHDLRVIISDPVMLMDDPEEIFLPAGKLVDELGQNKRKTWSGKVENVRELSELLKRQTKESRSIKKYPFKDWSIFGGWKKRKLQEGTGYFSKCKSEGRWYLVDPLGYAFFSMGPDCVGVGTDCRVEGVEQWLDWLPDRNDPEYEGMFLERDSLLFSFEQANLYRGLGDDWYEKWKNMVLTQLKRNGMNTLGNWSDERLLGTEDIPYVTSLPEFPDTDVHIFRDFPDVFSPEFERNAKKAAMALEKRKSDPLMIGYFLRNEPAWAFVDNLVLADEVLLNPADTFCKRELIKFLKEKYRSVEALNAAWGSFLSDFSELENPEQIEDRERTGILPDKVSEWSEASCADLREFSRRMLWAYLAIPCRVCREVDSNHMILGMRWAWVSDPDLVTGRENLDVFSINCYAVDPTAAITNITNLGVDLPVLIGEFHFGALDAGPDSTGLEGVLTQKERGTAYRYYCERVAAHPAGVGCHYFQCYDQFVLGRFDGENYNIGLFDICSQPYQEMFDSIRECSEEIYAVMSNEQLPAEEKPVSIPMIAF